MGDLTREHGGNIYRAMRKRKRGIIDFSANINPLGLPRGTKKAIRKNFDKILHYPDPDAKELRREIAKYWNVKEENILAGNGSAELIYLIASRFAPRTVLVSAPTFSEYERAAKCVKSEVKFQRLKEDEGFKLDLTRIPYADMLFVSNPNNPTGNLMIKKPEEAESFPAKLTVVDEAFMDFLPDERKRTLIPIARKNRKIIALRTLTKFFALPGLRIGYLVAHKDVIRALRQRQIPWSVNTFAQFAARAILNDRSYIKRTRSFIEKERNFLFNALSEIKGLTPFPSLANFILIKIGVKNTDALYLTKRLMRSGILIRNCANFRGLNRNFIRVAVRSRGENLRLLRALKEAM